MRNWCSKMQNNNTAVSSRYPLHFDPLLLCMYRTFYLMPSVSLEVSLTLSLHSKSAKYASILTNDDGTRVSPPPCPYEMFQLGTLNVWLGCMLVSNRVGHFWHAGQYLVNAWVSSWDEQSGHTSSLNSFVGLMERILVNRVRIFRKLLYRCGSIPNGSINPNTENYCKLYGKTTNIKIISYFAISLIALVHVFQEMNIIEHRQTFMYGPAGLKITAFSGSDWFIMAIVFFLSEHQIVINFIHHIHSGSDT